MNSDHDEIVKINLDCIGELNHDDNDIHHLTYFAKDDFENDLLTGIHLLKLISPVGNDALVKLEGMLDTVQNSLTYKTTLSDAIRAQRLDNHL